MNDNVSTGLSNREQLVQWFVLMPLAVLWAILRGLGEICKAVGGVLLAAVLIAGIVAIPFALRAIVQWLIFSK